MSVTSEEVKKLVEEVNRLIDLVSAINYRLTAVIDDVERLKKQLNKQTTD